MRRLIPPWESRNLRGWAALFLAAGTVAYALGYWEMSIVRSTAAVA